MPGSLVIIYDPKGRATVIPPDRVPQGVSQAMMMVDELKSDPAEIEALTLKLSRLLLESLSG